MDDPTCKLGQLNTQRHVGKLTLKLPVSKQPSRRSRVVQNNRLANLRYPAEIEFSAGGLHSSYIVLRKKIHHVPSAEQHKALDWNSRLGIFPRRWSLTTWFHGWDRSPGSLFFGRKGGQYHLVVGFKHLEKYESQWEGLSPTYIMENIKCLKPPTGHYLFPQKIGNTFLNYLPRYPLYLPFWVRKHVSNMAGSFWVFSFTKPDKSHGSWQSNSRGKKNVLSRGIVMIQNEP